MNRRGKQVSGGDLVNRLRSPGFPSLAGLHLRTVGPEDAPVASALVPSVERVFHTLAQGARDSSVVVEISLAPHGPERLEIDFRIISVNAERPQSSANREKTAMLAISKSLLGSGVDTNLRREGKANVGQVILEFEEGVTEPRIPQRKRYP